ncbi:MAG: hypothetical protein WKF54_04155 [Nocardioidaceae bacterium]
MSSPDAPTESVGGERVRSRGRPVVTAVALVAVVAAAVGCDRWGGEPTSNPVIAAGPDRSRPGAQAHLSEAVLRIQAAAVADHDRAGFLATWDSGAAVQGLAARTYANLTRLGVSRLDPLLAGATRSGGTSSWSAEVDLGWRLDGLRAPAATSVLRYGFTAVGGGALVTSITAPVDGRTPVWLLPGLDVRRGPRTLVVATDAATAQRVERLLTQAVDAVGAVLPSWRGSVVAYAPGTPQQFATLTATRPGDYHGIAAVTTTVDGSGDERSAAAIVVNPSVFGRLGPLGAHVVIAHEATHLATRAAAVSMPLWLAEGFADYVGIGSVDLPATVAAEAALDVVRRDGPPHELPTDASLSVGTAGLEATYESAWLATMLIDRTYGRQRLVAFYRWVQAHPAELDEGFDLVLGTTRSAFTAAWRDYLQELAGGG